jgi:hypothetical protein
MRIAYPDVNRDLLIKNLPFTGFFYSYISIEMSLSKMRLNRDLLQNLHLRVFFVFC